MKEDIKELYHQYYDPQISRYMGSRKRRYIERMSIDEFCEKFIKEHRYVILRKEDDKLVGCIWLYVDIYNRNAEIGYWVWKEYWNKGYATEAIKLMLDFGFKDLGLICIWAEVFESNKASQRVLEKNGFELGGKIEKIFYCEGKWENSLIYYKVNPYLKHILP